MPFDNSIRGNGKSVNRKNSLSNQTDSGDIAPLPGNVYGKDIALETAKKLFADAYRKGGKNTLKDGKVKFAASSQYDYSQSFDQQVDDYKNGMIPKGDTLTVGATPDVYKSIGFNALPMTINTTHVDYALYGTKDADHYFCYQTVI